MVSFRGFMAKKKNRSFAILFKSISKNFLNIIKHYPNMIYVANHPEKFTSDEQYEVGLKLIKLLIDTCKIKVEAYGFENIPEKDGFYLCANHQEKFDPLAIWYTFPRKIGVILDDKATHRPFIREICLLIKSQKLLRKDIRSTINSNRAITEDLSSGINYMIFPEGGYEVEEKSLGEFHAGSFKSPMRAHCPIVPVCIVDSYCIFDKGYNTTKPIQIHYLKPIMPEEYEGLKTQELAMLVKKRIQEVHDLYQL